MEKPRFTHCRCGASALFERNGKTYRKERCDNSKDGKPFVYHDLTAQSVNHMLFTNWDVKPEDGKFRAYAGNDPSPMLFDTEDAAWVELDQIYWGCKDWDEPEFED